MLYKPSSSDAISFSKSLHGLTDWSSSSSNNTTESTATFNSHEEVQTVFLIPSQTNWQGKSSPIKAPQALSQSMYKKRTIY